MKIPPTLPCFTFLLGVYLLTGCSEDEKSFPATPTIETGSVAVKEIGGAFISGQLTQHDMIADHGFIYGQDSLLTPPFITWVPLGKPTQSGSFEYHLATGLKNAEVYYFRSYILVNGAYVFGEIKSFFSNGSVAPKIDRISAEKGYLGESIVIYGKYFGTNTIYTKVKFGDIHSEFNYVTDTAISVKVPNELTSYNMQLKVSVFDKSVEIPFQLHTPEIHSITPQLATFREIITLLGGHFDTIPSHNEIWLGDAKAIVVSSTRNEIKFIVPDYLRLGKTEIKVKSQAQEVLSEDFFTLHPPEIYEFPECIASDTHIEINGTNFHPFSSLNRVFFGDTEATVIGGTTTRLQLTVPFGPFPMSKARIKVQVADVLAEADRDVCISDEWVMISKSLPFGFYGDIGTFSFPSRGYVIAKSNGDRVTHLWEFNPVNESWAKSNLPFALDLLGTAANNEQKGYVYLATDKDNFWEFDPGTKLWKKSADFPGGIRYGGAMFCIGNQIYLGAGKISSYWNTTYYRDFYSYNAETNRWVRLKDFTTPSLSVKGPSSFVIDNQAYLAGGSLANGQLDGWKYIPQEDRWDPIADLPEAYDRDLHFSLNGKGYIMNGASETWEYDPVVNRWSEFYKVGHINRREGFVFVTNGTAYIGGGESSFVTIPDTWKELYRLNK